MKKTLLPLLAIAILAPGCFGLGFREGFRKRQRHSFENGYRWGYFERAQRDQQIRAAQSHNTSPLVLTAR